MFRLSHLILLACAASAFGAPAGNAPDAAISQAKAVMAGLPLRFEANQGQLAPTVLYGAHANGYHVLLGAAGPSISVGSHRVGMSLVHGNRAPRVEALDPLPTRTDFLIGNRSQWHTGIHSFGRVRYSGVYPGIDVVYYGNQSQLEYDFVLAPGADPAAIRMQFRGADRLHINADGDLVVAAAGSEIVQRRPVVYQRDSTAAGRHEVATHYALLGRNTVGFRVDNYDRASELVIDPVLAYCTYLGGHGTDRINAVKYFNGQLYMVGQTDTSDQPPTGGAWANNLLGIGNVTLGIVDTTQSGFPMTYFAYIGGQNIDIPLAVDVDRNGVAYITGTTTSTNFPLTPNAFQTSGAGANTSAFVMKVDPSQYGGNSLVFSSFLSGTTGTDVGNGVAVGPDGLIYVIGTARSTDFPITANAYQQALWGTQDTFICQIDPVAGALNYSTYLGGEDEDDGRGILVDKNSLVYFTASTLSQQFPVAGLQYNPNPIGASDVIFGVMDLSKAGTDSLIYSTYFGGSGNEEVRGMAFDSKGNVAITGYTLSTDFPVTRDAVQSSYGGNGDAFLALFNPSLASGAGLLYSTYLGGSHGEVGYGIGSDASNNLYVTGYTLSKDLPIRGSVPQPSWGGGTDLFVAEVRRGVAGMAGLQYSTYLGASNTYVPSGMAVGPDGTAYAVGYGGIGLPTSANASQSGGYAGGLTDGFLAVLAPGTPTTTVTTAAVPATADTMSVRITKREPSRPGRGCLAPAGHRGIEPCLHQGRF